MSKNENLYCTLHFWIKRSKRWIESHFQFNVILINFNLLFTSSFDKNFSQKRKWLICGFVDIVRKLAGIIFSCPRWCVKPTNSIFILDQHGYDKASSLSLTHPLSVVGLKLRFDNFWWKISISSKKMFELLFLSQNLKLHTIMTFISSYQNKPLIGYLWAPQSTKSFVR